MKPLGWHRAGPRDTPRSSRARRASARPARRCRQPAVLRARVGARRCRLPAVLRTALVPARRCRLSAVLSNARLVSIRQAGGVEVRVRCADIEPSTLRLTEFRVPAGQRPRNRGPTIKRSGGIDGIGPFHAPPACIGQEVWTDRPQVSGNSGTGAVTLAPWHPGTLARIACCPRHAPRIRHAGAGGRWRGPKLDAARCAGGSAPS